MAEASRAALPEQPRVVVMVPTLDNRADLSRCLEALSAQRGAAFEVLVVDSRPSAASAELSARHAARYLEDKHGSRAAACNFALEQLACDIVIFTDDDCYPPPGWVANLVRHFGRPEVAGVGGPHVAPRDQSFWGKVVDVAFAAPLLTLGLRYAKSYRLVCEVPHNPGCNAAYRTEVLREVGGFTHAPFGAEDVALDHMITKRGHRLWFDPDAVTFHRRRDRVPALGRQMWAYGRGRADTNARFPEVARISHAFPAALVLFCAAVLALALVLVAAWLGTSWQLDGWLPTTLMTAPLWGAACFYVVAAAAAAFSSSPYRSVATVIVSPIVMAFSILQYGRGFLHWHRTLKPQFRLGKL